MTICMTCGSLADFETGFSKYGWPDQTVSLPPERSKLKEIVSYISSRGDTLYQCPECLSYFHYNLDYEFLVGGSEDTETLTRISAEDAEKLRIKIESNLRK